MPRQSANDDAKKRHPKGIGSVFQRSDGYWIAQMTLENGWQKQFSAKSEKEANAALRKALDDLERGSLITETDQLLRHYLEDWLEHVKRPSIKRSRYLRYRDLLDQQILPALGHLTLQKLKPEHLEGFYARKLKEGLSAATIHLIHGVVHQAVEKAVSRQLLAYNVCDDATLPRITRHERQVLNEEQVHKLLEVARGHRFEVLMTLALATGMSRGELLALQWKDIDWNDGSLDIRHSVNWYSGQGFVVSEPKSRRKIMLPGCVLDLLRQQCAHQRETRLKAGSAWQDHDVVFCNGTGNFSHPTHLGVDFQRFLKQAGLPHIRFHNLRNSTATLLLAMGVNPAVIQELLGHSHIPLTLGTSPHVLPEMLKEAMEKMNELFRRPEDDGHEEVQ